MNRDLKYSDQLPPGNSNLLSIHVFVHKEWKLIWHKVVLPRNDDFGPYTVVTTLHSQHWELELKSTALNFKL